MGVCHVSWLAAHSLSLDEDLDYAFLKFQGELMDHDHTAVQMKAHQPPEDLVTELSTLTPNEVKANAALYCLIFFQKVSESGLIPHKSCFRIRVGCSHSGSLTCPGRQQPQNSGKFHVELPNFSQSK